MTALIPQTDSRLYRHAFMIRSRADFPEGFESPEKPIDFRFAVFLPAPARGRSGAGAAAPTVLSICCGQLAIQRHYSLRERPIWISLVDLRVVESARFLLCAWLRLVFKGLQRMVPYHARNSAVVDQFLAALRQEWLSGPAGRRQPELPPEALSFGSPLNFKFQQAESAELDHGETIAIRFFSPATVTPRGRFWRGERWSPSDLLAIADRRVLWITDRYEGTYARYGACWSYARRDALRRVSLAPVRPGWELRFAFADQLSWSIRLAPGIREQAERFVEQVRVLCRPN
jgi:hypothetical protein